MNLQIYIRSQCVGPDDIFVSFDVESLDFSFVSSDQALDLVLQLLANDNTFHGRTSLL